MNREEFLNKIEQSIQVSELKESDYLIDLPEWDSLAITSSIVAFSTFLGLKPNMYDLNNCNTVKELLDLGAEKYE